MRGQIYRGGWTNGSVLSRAHRLPPGVDDGRPLEWTGPRADDRARDRAEGGPRARTPGRGRDGHVSQGLRDPGEEPRRLRGDLARVRPARDDPGPGLQAGRGADQVGPAEPHEG